MSEINRYTNLEVAYSAVKTGRNHKVSKIIFKIRNKNSFQAYTTYLKAVERINRKNGQIAGQLSLFDLRQEDFDNEQYQNEKDRER